MNNGKITLIIGIIIVAIVLVVVFLSKSTLIIKTNPNQNVQITINGQKVNTENGIKLKPGTYDVKVELADYIPYQKNIKLGMFGTKTISFDFVKAPTMQKVTDYPVNFASLSADKKSIYYLSNNGKTMYAIDNIEAAKLQTEVISPDFFTGVTNIIWSPTTTLAIIKQDKNTSLYDFKRYDLLHQEIYPFGEGIGNIVWSPDGEKILYYYAPSGGETTLIEANKDNTGMERVYNFLDTGISNPELSWSADGQNALALAKNKLNLFDFFGKKLVPVLPDTQISEAQFTPDNDIIYRTSDGLHICDKNGQNDWKLEINTTLDKIYFYDQSNLYYSEKINATDTFFQFDLSTNTKTQIAYSSKQKINPTNLIVSENLKRLYFESDGYLYFLDITAESY